MNRRLPAAIALAALVCTLALAVPAGAATVVVQTLGRKAVTYSSYPFDATPTSRWTASAQGESVDTNGNGIADSLRGRAAVLEDFGVIRARIYFVRTQALIGGNWTTVQANEVDKVSEAPRAYAISYTPTNRYCGTDPALTRQYRVVNSHGVRRVDGIVANRTLVSNTFTARALALDPACPETPPPPPPPTPDPADLEVTIADSPDPVLDGEQLTYTVNSSNQGDASAPNAQLVVNLDDTLNASTADPRCVESATGNVFTCNLGTLEGGEANQVVIVAVPTSDADLSATAQLTATGVSSDTDVEDTVVVQSADLSIIKTMAPTPDPTDPANRYLVTFTVDNAGPDTATTVVVTDAWPVHLSDPSAVSAGCAFDNDADVLRCTDASITQADAPVVFQAIVTVLADGTNTATVDAAQADPDLEDNTDSATVNL